MRKVFLVAALLLVGCDKLVDEKVLEVVEAKQQISCTYTGFCFACGWSGGEYKCGAGLHSYCGGNQDAKVRIQTVKQTFERSDKTRYDEIMKREHVIEFLSSCS